MLGGGMSGYRCAACIHATTGTEATLMMVRGSGPHFISFHAKVALD